MMIKKLWSNVALVTLLAFAPTTVACSSNPDDAADNNPAAQGAALEIVGASGNKSTVAIPEAQVKSVTSNTATFVVDGKTTSDFAEVLAGKRIEIKGADGTTGRTLLREGSKLYVEGGTSGAHVEVEGSLFTIVTAGGRWDCYLRGMADDTTKKLAGAMSLGVLVGLESDTAAAVEEGRCEAVCIVAISIVVSIAILAALIAYAICETTGQDKCIAKARSVCGTNNVKSARKDCAPILTGSGKEQNGRIVFQGGCRLECR